MNHAEIDRAFGPVSRYVLRDGMKRFMILLLVVPSVGFGTCWALWETKDSYPVIALLLMLALMVQAMIITLGFRALAYYTLNGVVPDRLIKALVGTLGTAALNEQQTADLVAWIEQQGETVFESQVDELRELMLSGAQGAIDQQKVEERRALVAGSAFLASNVIPFNGSANNDLGGATP